MQNKAVGRAALATTPTRARSQLCTLRTCAPILFALVLLHALLFNQGIPHTGGKVALVVAPADSVDAVVPLGSLLAQDFASSRCFVPPGQCAFSSTASPLGYLPFGSRLQTFPAEARAERDTAVTHATKQGRSAPPSLRAHLPPS